MYIPNRASFLLPSGQVLHVSGDIFPIVQEFTHSKPLDQGQAVFSQATI
jgi:hypothetical protein